MTFLCSSSKLTFKNFLLVKTLVFILYADYLNGSIYLGQGQALSELPDNISFDVTRVELGRNSLHSLNASIIANWYQINELNIEQNNFKTFPDLCAIGLTLTELNIRVNKINLVNSSYLECLNSIEVINLGINNIHYFPNISAIGNTLKELLLYRNSVLYLAPDVFYNVTALIWLDLSYNRLTTLPHFIYAPDALSYLTISKNRLLTDIHPDSFSGFKSLQTLNLIDDNLKSFPNLCHLYENRIKIYLMGNIYPTLNPAYINCLKNLSVIEMESQYVDTANGLNLTNSAHSLSELRIRNTKITTIEYLGQLYSMSILTLGQNQLIQLTGDLFEKWTSLEELYLNDNKDLMGVPNLSDMKGTLRILDLSGCSFIAPHFGPLPNLRILDLSNNNLGYLDENFFLGFNSIETLYLNGNKNLLQLPILNEIKDTLKVLDLSDCGFKVLNVYSFTLLNNLQNLRLSGLNTTFIPSTCSKNPSSLTISVDNLPLCICQNLWIKQAQLDGSSVSLSNSLSCGSYDWASSSMNDVYKSCTAATFGHSSLYHFKIKRTMTDFLCHYPVIASQPNKSMYQCASSCIHTSGCYSFNYRPVYLVYGINYGDCMLVVPSSDGITLPENFAKTRWTFYQFEYNWQLD